MRLMKYILVMICMMQIVSAKRTGAPTIPVQTSIPTTQPVIKPTSTIPQPIIKPVIQPTQVIQPTLPQQSYANALNIIKNQMRSDQVLKDNQFTDQFINFVRDSVKNSGDNASIFARALLEAGAYLNATFTNEQVINVTIISDLNDEINRQMRAMQPIVKEVEAAKVTMHLVPTDVNILRNYGLCPLFGQAEVAALDPELRKQLIADFRAQNMSEEEIQEQLASLAVVTVPPHYSIFNGVRFEHKNISRNVPCVVELGISNNWNRVLMQLKSLDQFELADVTKLDPALCGGHSLNNGRLIREYALTGNMQYLRDLQNIGASAIFLKKLGIGSWLNVEDVRANIEKLRQMLGIDGVDVSAVSTVSLFDSELDKKLGWAVFDPQEFAYVQKVKQNIRVGLQQDNYVHIMIIGNEEATEALGHYFCFAIIKVDNAIQYIVLDTIPSVYHLQPGSHERDRLMFVIDNIEKGSSSITVTNLRTRSEFFESVKK